MNAQAAFGPQLHHGSVTFRLWAPVARRVDLMLAEEAHPMPRREGGWHEARIARAGAGTRYKFRIDDERDVSDPASSFQPEDVFGPSEVIDHAAFAWQAKDWRGRPWEEAVFLELHVGAFTPAGTFQAAIERLDHIVAMGITAIELMPIADFAGRRNWGYDGVLLYAPDSVYGRPEDLKALIDAAHQRGLMVFLDVVYNHFGPEGNYLGRYAPSFFIEAHTPWGAAIDYRIPQARAFAVENALHWLEHYRFDGLRLDATHAITEPGTPHLLHDLSSAVGDLALRSGRHVHLVLENDDNDARLLDPPDDPPRGKYRAQWNDDYHHAWHVLLTGEKDGHYCDYQKNPQNYLARILASGFAYQGEPSEHRKGQKRGEPSGHLPPTAFVNFLQNHDQIGNRAQGDRLITLADEAAMKAAMAVTLLAPMPPLLFMGEEWGSMQPFPFFCDFKGPLGDAVRQGRRAEFKSAGWGNDIPDPLAEETFRSAILDWKQRDTPHGQAWMTLVRELLRTRQKEIAPRLWQTSFLSAQCQGDILAATWRLSDAHLTLLANLGDSEATRPDVGAMGRAIFGGDPPETLPPWSVYWGFGDA